eukprot:1156258-Pelagomonas_calceolata.AAC.5
MQAVEILPTAIKEKRIPRAEAPCIPFTKINKRKESMEIRRVVSKFSKDVSNVYKGHKEKGKLRKR